MFVCYFVLCLSKGIVWVVVRCVYLSVGIEVSVMTQGWMGEGGRGKGLLTKGRGRANCDNGWGTDQSGKGIFPTRIQYFKWFILIPVIHLIGN